MPDPLMYPPRPPLPAGDGSTLGDYLVHPPIRLSGGAPPYSPEERERLAGLMTEAMDGDPGEAGEPPLCPCGEGYVGHADHPCTCGHLADKHLGQGSCQGRGADLEDRAMYAYIPDDEPCLCPALDIEP